MSKRRDLLKMPALLVPAAALMAAKAPGLKNVTIDEGKAKLTKEPFGDLRIYFDGSTDQLNAMTAGVR